MKLQIPEFFDKTPFRVTPDKDKVIVLNTHEHKITGLVKAELYTSDFPRVTGNEIAENESGGTAAAGIYRYCDDKFSVCFPASLEPGECSVFRIVSGSGAKSSPYNDTVKTSEGEYYHITACDNGTLIISDKRTGSIFFEMPTFILSNAPADNGFTYKTEVFGTHASVIRHSSAVHTVFSSIIPLYIPDNKNELKVISQVLHGKEAPELLFYTEYGSLPEGMTLTLRLPTGLAYPSFSVDEALPVAPETYGNHLDIAESLTLSGEEGVQFKAAFDERISASVSCDGNIDIVLPANRYGSFGYTISIN